MRDHRGSATGTCAPMSSNTTLQLHTTEHSRSFCCRSTVGPRVCEDTVDTRPRYSARCSGLFGRVSGLASRDLEQAKRTQGTRIFVCDCVWQHHPTSTDRRVLQRITWFHAKDTRAWVESDRRRNLTLTRFDLWEPKTWWVEQAGSTSDSWRLSPPILVYGRVGSVLTATVQHVSRY